MVHIQIYGHIPFFFILGRGLFQCPPFRHIHFYFVHGRNRDEDIMQCRFLLKKDGFCCRNFDCFLTFVKMNI
jgi:hypothetical protein